jgi:predicted aconitase
MMQLTSEEQAMRDGHRGEAVRRAIEMQIKVGEFFGASRFVPVTNVHMMGDIEVMGDVGLRFLRETRSDGARCVRPTTTNARCVDFAHAAQLRQDAGEVAKEREVIGCLRDMNVATVDTCINYQTVYQPHLGEHIAWGDTGTVIYANSVFGARSNFESGPAAFAAALTGRTPAYGFHLDEHRRGTLLVEVDAQLNDVADWGALGKLVGEANQDYFAVPVFTRVDRTPTADELKHLGCSLASYGSMAMYHMIGVTPEAPTIDRALGGARSVPTMRVTDADIESVYRRYPTGDGTASVVVFSGPQLSLLELKTLARLFAGRSVHPNVRVFITTNHAILADARRLGYAQTLEAAGATILEGVCFYILQRLTEIRRENGWVNLISNSAKIVNTITAHRFRTILRRTEECVEIAVRGRLA